MEAAVRAEQDDAGQDGAAEDGEGAACGVI
jgi:hypothetical protein